MASFYYNEKYLQDSLSKICFVSYFSNAKKVFRGL